ncbi:putative membrane protein [Mariprofundus ferrinatatus]|uniref:Putative membrane protein n=1 Tax=Mariprofundus ferrinatatus TaxID=1921087 RepID=A0A2K8L5K5_9PROT|nr:hypothetical protein [Mariprofundus ferrinatatus]ATX82600.1 putative membrane protein [Mariprofundus ferrinatatus]
MNSQPEIVPEPSIESAKKAATIVYALQAASFLLAVTFIAAIIVNYVKKDDVADTWVASHFRWQMRTFWFALLWSFIGIVTLMLGIGWFIMMGTAVWVIYRIAKGWLALSDDKAMYIED